MTTQLNALGGDTQAARSRAGGRHRGRRCVWQAGKPACLLLGLALVGLLSAAASGQGLVKAEVTMQFSQTTFGKADAPLRIGFTFRNAGDVPFVLCPNRIDIHGAIKLIVVRSPDEFPKAPPEWNGMVSPMPDHFHGDAEKYVTVAPGKAHLLSSDFYAVTPRSFRSLLDLLQPDEGHYGHRGVYYVRAYFNGAECPVVDAPQDVARKLLRSRLESNTVKVTVTETSDGPADRTDKGK